MGSRDLERFEVVGRGLIREFAVAASCHSDFNAWIAKSLMDIRQKLIQFQFATEIFKKSHF